MPCHTPERQAHERRESEERLCRTDGKKRQDFAIVFRWMQDWFSFLCVEEKRDCRLDFRKKALDRLWWQQFPLSSPPAQPGPLQSVGSGALSIEDKSTSSRSAPDLIWKSEEEEKYSGSNQTLSVQNKFTPFHLDRFGCVEKVNKNAPKS